jgi:hemoglobin
MDQDHRFAAVRAVHETDLSRARQSLFEFLSGWLGGPPLYFERSGHRCVMSAHARFPIGLNEASQWLGCMNQAMVDCKVDKDLRGRLNTAFAAMANGMRNKP